MFKESFKFYKSKNPPPNLDNVLDFNNSDKLLQSSKIKILEANLKCECNNFGLKPSDSWEIFEIIERPGLIFVKNPFTNIGQRYWCVRTLRDYSKKPNKTNIDAQNLIPDNKDWWEFCNENNKHSTLNKLRWVTLGYHHNWDTKIYSEDNKGDFPQDLKDLCSCMGTILGFNNFNAEAAIVNFYHMDSTLSGHTDHSEKDLEAPLFSFSFGQTAVFLLGSQNKDEEPLAMFLRSGDAIVMSKEARLCYHGVPKILQIDSRSWDNVEEIDLKKIEQPYSYSKDVFKICRDDDLWKPFGDFLTHSRININVRQVLARGTKRLNSGDLDEKSNSIM